LVIYFKALLVDTNLELAILLVHKEDQGSVWRLTWFLHIPLPTSHSSAS
jgi:hypothetical protein